MYFLPIRILFLIFGVAFLSFSSLFAISRKKQQELILPAIFLANFALFFLLLAFWDTLAVIRPLTHIASLLIGLPLVPIGLRILATLFGELEYLRAWLRFCVLATLSVFVICVVMHLLGMDKLWPLALSRIWAFVCYVVTISIGVFRLRPHSSLPRQLLQFLLFLGLCVLMLSSLVVFQTFDLGVSHLVIWLLLAILFCFVAATVYRHPNAFKLVEEQAKSVRYSHSLLSNVDIPSKLAEIDRLMREKQLYRDPELSLKQLAKYVQLNLHQLSELLNTYAKQNFASYLLNFRIEQAKRELADPKDTSILTIAFSCGFNSKSTFNTAFRKATGVTPSTFRKNEGSKPQPKKTGV